MTQSEKDSQFIYPREGTKQATGERVPGTGNRRQGNQVNMKKHTQAR